MIDAVGESLWEKSSPATMAPYVRVSMPGFFSVAQEPGPVTVTSQMTGTDLGDHILFQGVDSIADAVSNSFQATHGDSLAQNGAYSIIAHDSGGRPAIAVGEIDLSGNGTRPFVLDAGFQRYYAVQNGGDTGTLLGNLLMYLGNVGCHADPPR